MILCPAFSAFERGFISFQSNLVSNFFSFFNVILFSGSGLTNVALNKPATQSTYHQLLGRPENVVDGNKGISIYQCTHTANPDTNPDRWWRVDLQGMFEIHTVVITNREGVERTGIGRLFNENRETKN